MKLEFLEVISGTSPLQPMATIRLNVNEREEIEAAVGNGPVDAALKAVDKIVQKHVILEEFLVQAITQGSDDVGKVHMQLKYKDQVYYGYGADTDIVVASVKAYIDGLNKIGK
jgi:2-isopropylmalate synthase